MFDFVRDLAGNWADNRFVRANRVLRYRLKLAEADVERLTRRVESLRTRYAINRDVRVRAETAVEQLTAAHLKLSGLLADGAAPVVDPVAVAVALKSREEAGGAYVRALKAYLVADAEYREAFNGVYVREGGPEHLRKVTAEDRAAGERAARDVAEVTKVEAEQAVRLAELGFRAAMGGAAPDGGDRA